MGSPRVAGSTIRSMAEINCGYLSTVDFRPPPGRRCRRPTTALSARLGSAGSSRLPCKMVMLLVCSASATARIPPEPNESASLAAHSLRPRSPRWAFSRSYFSRTTCFRSSRTLRKAAAFLACRLANCSRACWDPPSVRLSQHALSRERGICPLLVVY
jgi:hypothetical protein